MHVHVKRLRQRGGRLSNREIENSPVLAGDLSLSGLAAGYILDLRDPNRQVEEGLVARLYEARLITMHGDRMLFKGEERPQGDAGPAVVQEWSVVIAVP